jgi:hypothetical protein
MIAKPEFKESVLQIIEENIKRDSDTSNYKSEEILGIIIGDENLEEESYKDIFSGLI